MRLLPGTLVVLLLCALYGVGLGIVPLRLPDEVVSAEVARESAVRSPFAAPRLLEQPAPRAPLLPWAARHAFAGSSPVATTATTGGPGESAAVLTTTRPEVERLRALSAGFLLAMAAMVFFLGRGWFSLRTGALAALFTGAAPLALERGRSFTPESALALGVTVAVGSALLAIRAVSGKRFLSYLGTTALGSAFSLLASGLTGPALTIAILTVAIFAERGARGLLTLRALSVLVALLTGVAIGLAIVLPGLITAEGGSLAGAFLKGSLASFVRAPETARAASLLERFTLPLGLLPALFFAFFAGRGRVHQLAPGGHPELPLLLLVAWAAVPVTLAVALAGGAARALVLAALPPLALLAANAVLEPPRQGKEAKFLQLFWLGLRGVGALALVGLAVLALQNWSPGAALWDPAGLGNGLLPFAIPIVLAVLLAIGGRLSEAERTSTLPQPTATIGALAILLLAWQGIWHPAREEARSDTGQELVLRLERTVGRPLDPLVRTHGLDPALRAAIAYERGVPLVSIDDAEAARAWLSSAPAEARLVLPTASFTASREKPGALEGEIRTPLGRISVVRGSVAPVPHSPTPEPLAPAPSAPTGTADPGR